MSCVWLRGIPPTAAYPDLEPPDAVSCSVHGCFDALPGGVVFATDGSGGANTSDARLRRCGWSVCALSFSPSPDILAAAWGPLPGRQTVPRSELYALCVLLALCPAQAITVHIDCFPVYQGWKAGQEACTKGSAMDDLWWVFWGLLRPRPGALLLLWCPSHTTPAGVAQGLLSKEAFLANAAADSLASRAAAAAQLSPDLVQRVREVDALVLSVQDRLVAINLAVAQELGPLRRTWRKRHKEEPATRLAALRDATSHRLARQGRTVFCAVCLQSCQLALQARWLARGPCPGPPLRGRGRRLLPGLLPAPFPAWRRAQSLKPMLPPCSAFFRARTPPIGWFLARVSCCACAAGPGRQSSSELLAVPARPLCPRTVGMPATGGTRGCTRGRAARGLPRALRLLRLGLLTPLPSEGAATRAERVQPP